MHDVVKPDIYSTVKEWINTKATVIYLYTDRLPRLIVT